VIKNISFIICFLLLTSIFVLMFIFKKPIAVPDLTDRPGSKPAAPSASHIFGLGTNGEDF
jgi:hypothetical protein